MPRTPETSVVRYIFEGFQRAIAENPNYIDEKLIVDMWDRENFSGFVDYKFTDAEWDDFVDFCSHEQVPWQDWFEQWRNGGRKV